MPRLPHRTWPPGRWPAAVWILAPLAIGLLYALGYALLAPKPTLADLPPSDAILVQRFRNLAMLDRASFGARGPGVRSARDRIAAARNVPGLPGVDHTGPVHMILMPRTRRTDSTMAVFRVEDAEAFEKAFNRSDFIERDLVRHAQHLVRRGPWAAVAPNRDDARRIGKGGITAADLGEDQSLAADVPRLVDHALSLARSYPWRSILRTLGVQVDALYTREDEQTGAPVPVLAGDDRLAQIRSTWAEARLWAWFEPGKMRVELVPQAGAMADALADAFEHHRPLDGRPASAPHAPADSEVWARVSDHRAVGLTARLLRACGVRLLPELQETEAARDPLGGLGGDAPDGVLIWGVPVRGSGHALTIGVASRTLPILSAFLPMPADGAVSVPLAKGAAPLTLGATRAGLEAPAGTVEISRGADGLDVLAFGAGARGAIDGMRSHLAAGLDSRDVGGAAAHADPAFRVFAAFFLKQGRAVHILGGALEPGGFLAALALGDIRGTLSTDGKRVRVEAWIAE